MKGRFSLADTVVSIKTEGGSEVDDVAIEKDLGEVQEESLKDRMHEKDVRPRLSSKEVETHEEKKMVISKSSVDTDGLQKKSSEAKVSKTSGAMLSLRGKLAGVNDADDSNPWFQTRDDQEKAKKTVRGNSSFASSQSIGSDKSGKERFRGRKMKRLKKLGRMFRKDDAASASAITNDFGSMSSDESVTMTTSSTDENMFASKETSQAYSSDMESLAEHVRMAVQRKTPLMEILGLLIQMPERPNDQLTDPLFSYMSHGKVLEAGVKILIDDQDPGMFKTRSRDISHGYKPFREFLIHAYVAGPQGLRKSLLHHNKARGELFTYLGALHPESPASERFCLKIHNLVTILNSLLRDFPIEFTEVLVSKRGFLSSIVRHYIHIPEVGDFIAQVCASNAITLPHGGDGGLHAGRPNAAGIVQLARESIPNTLVFLFGEAAYPTGGVRDEQLRWQLQVTSISCLLDLSKRALVVSKFTKTNCSHGHKLIKAANQALETLNPFANLAAVRLIVESGLGALYKLGKMGSGASLEQKALCNNAAECALRFVTELLDMVHSAADSKKLLTRDSVGKIKTKGFEEILVEKIEELCSLLGDKQRVLGRMRVAIVRLFRGLFGSRHEGTRRALVEHRVAGRLLEAIRMNPRSSIVHGCVVECLAMGLVREESGRVHRMWLSELQRRGVLEEMAAVIQRKGKLSSEDLVESRESTLDSTLVDVGFVLVMFSQNLTRAEFRDMFDSQRRYDIFTEKIEKGLRRVEEQRREACGGPKPEGAIVSVLADATALAARLNDFEAV